MQNNPAPFGMLKKLGSFACHFIPCIQILLFPMFDFLHNCWALNLVNIAYSPQPYKRQRLMFQHSTVSICEAMNLGIFKPNL